MRIRLKFFSLLLLLFGAFAISVAVYFIVLAPVTRIRAEESDLTDLQSAISTEEIELNRLAREPFGQQTAAIDLAYSQMSNSFAVIGNLKVLPRTSASIRDALGVIENLRKQIEKDRTQFQDAVATVQTAARAIYSSNTGFDLPSLITAPAVRVQGPDSSIVADVKQLFTSMEVLDETLKESVSALDRQSVVVNNEVARIDFRSKILAAAIIVALAGLAFIIFIVVTGRLARTIRRVESGIAMMKHGNLAVEFSALSNDEMGVLAANLNQFCDSLKVTIGHIQSASHDNLQMKEKLISDTQQTNSSITEIDASAESIGVQIGNLDSRLSEAADAVDAISGSTSVLNDQVSEQSSMVEQSTASVTEMIASLEAIAESTARRLDATEQLTKTTAAGGSRAAATYDALQKINQNVDDIRNIAGVIGGISAQTNLLAMNAAIEAAHAGEAGRGFSVVADEIRNLSEQSATQAKEIDRIVRLMVELIVNANATSSELNGAFGSIDREVRELLQSLSEVSATMNELRTGSNQVLEATAVLRDSSTAVREGAATIAESTAAVRGTMQAVQQVSAQVRGGMREIAAGIRDIARSIVSVHSSAEQIGLLGESLNRDLQQFRTRRETDDVGTPDEPVGDSTKADASLDGAPRGVTQFG